MDLSTSSKPYDCVTASYLLNFLVHHKGLQHICLGKWFEHNPQMDENTSVSTVENNTLAGKLLGKWTPMFFVYLKPFYFSLRLLVGGIMSKRCLFLLGF